MMSQLQYDVLFDVNVDEKIARIKLTDDKFGGIIYRYDVVSFKEDRNDEATLKFDYEIIESPENVDVDALTEGDHSEFETTIGNILVEIITEATSSENRADDTGKSDL